MARVTVVGMGPGPLSWMTVEAERELRAADKVIFRTSNYPAYDWLNGLGKKLISFDGLYALPWQDTDDLYDFMATAVLKEANLRGQAIYVVPGSLGLLEDAARVLQVRGEAEGVEVRLLHGMSFLEPALSAVKHDGGGLQIVLPRSHVRHGYFSAHVPLLVCQIEARELPQDPPQVGLTMQWLLRVYPPDHEVTLVWTSGLPDYETRTKVLPLADLARAHGDGKYYYASLYVPALV